MTQKIIVEKDDSPLKNCRELENYFVFLLANVKMSETKSIQSKYDTLGKL